MNNFNAQHDAALVELYAEESIVLLHKHLLGEHTVNNFNAKFDAALVELYAAEQAADSQLTEAEQQHKYAQIQALNNMLDFMAECMDNGPVRY